MKILLQDVRYGLRMLRKSPGFTAVAIITLALGIGANTAIFSLINAIMLRTLPVRDPQSLVMLKWTARRFPDTAGSSNYSDCPREVSIPEGCSFSFPMFQQIEGNHGVFSEVSASVPKGFTVNANGRTRRVQGSLVSSSFFSMLGANPALGRVLSPADDAATAVPAAVISYHFWQNGLDSDPAIIGKSLLVDKTPVTVVGIAAPEFLGLDSGVWTDLWLPLSLEHVAEPHPESLTSSNSIWLEVVARLKPGVSARQAASVMSTLFAASVTNGPEAMFRPADAPRIELPTAAHGLATLRKSFSRPLFVMFIAVALVLLIACANIAGLMLARSAGRRKEVAMRAALGATRGRIVRQFLTESVLLSIAGGGAGMLLGYWSASLLAAIIAFHAHMLRVDIHTDFHVFAFTLLVSTVVGLTFGLAPALSSGRVDLVPALKEGSGNSTAANGRWISAGNSLVIAQMGLAMLVLVGAGLLVRTFANLKAVGTGFDARSVLLFSLDTTYSRLGKNVNGYYDNLRDQLMALPGVSSVSYSSVPLVSGGSTTTIAQDGSGADFEVYLLPIGPGFFRTMNIPLIAGRDLTRLDLESERLKTGNEGQPTQEINARKAILINETLAHRLFGTQNPIGRHFRMAGPTGPESEIVGLVGDGKYDSLRNPVPPTVYGGLGIVCTLCGPPQGASFEIRARMDPKALVPAVRAAVNRFDSNLLITDMKTQMEQIDQNIYQERLIANLSSLFALLALIVACVGIYGLLSYQVSRRTQEIGIRLALGAQRGDVLRLVIQQGALLAVLGALLGTAAALAVTRYLQSFLFGVKPSDPVTIAAVALGLIAVALLASYIPARRAMRTDPMVALRYE